MGGRLTGEKAKCSDLLQLSQAKVTLSLAEGATVYFFHTWVYGLRRVSSSLVSAVMMKDVLLHFDFLSTNAMQAAASLLGLRVDLEYPCPAIH